MSLCHSNVRTPLYSSAHLHTVVMPPILQQGAAILQQHGPMVCSCTANTIATCNFHGKNMHLLPIQRRDVCCSTVHPYVTTHIVL